MSLSLRMRPRVKVFPEKQFTDRLGSAKGEDPACIRDIFRLGDIVRPGDNPYEINIDIYPGVTTLKTVAIITAGRNSGNAGRKGKITSFSSKSRNNLLKHFGMMEVTPEVWQTFTFADDVMEGRTIEERKEFSSYCLNRFEKFLTKHYPNVGTWKRNGNREREGYLRGNGVHISTTCIASRIQQPKSI